MTQTVNPSSKRVIAVLAVLLAASLIGLNILFLAYNSEMNNKNAQIKDLNDRLSAVEGQSANQTVSAPSAPRLIAVGMHYIDNRTDANAPFLQVTGYVINVGNAKANNCSIRIYAIQNGNNSALDTSEPIYPIEPGTSQTVNLQFPYTGTPLVAYTSNLEWNK